MKYEEIQIDNLKHIIIDNEDGSFKSFPADPENPEYVAFLESQPKKTSATKTTVVEEPVAPEEE
jgi:hypothetical protein